MDINIPVVVVIALVKLYIKSDKKEWGSLKI